MSEYRYERVFWEEFKARRLKAAADPAAEALLLDGFIDGMKCAANIAEFEAAGVLGHSHGDIMGAVHAIREAKATLEKQKAARAAEGTPAAN